jgi:hypothetical protein
MRRALLLASIVAVFQPLWSLSALAAMVNYDRPTKSLNIQGRLDAKRIGSVKLDKSAVVMSGNKVDIIFETVDLTEKVEDGDKRLTGTTFKTTFDGGNTEGKVTGLLLLEGGSSLHELDSPGSTDTVKLTDGTTHTGKIVSCTDKYLQIQTDITNRTIDAANIAEISSARVFKFELPVRTSSDMTGKTNIIADASQITFTPTISVKAEVQTTSKAEPKKVEPKVEKVASSSSRKKKVLIIGAIGLCLIATAIAVPIAVACGTSGGGNNRAAEQQLALFNMLRAQQLRAATPVMAP